MKLIPLKQDKFIYCKRTYIQKRYVTNDMKYYITLDGLNYVLVYQATENGKGKLISELYHKNNYNSYPIYTIEDAIIKLKKLNNSNPFTLEIHSSHLKNH